MENPEKYLITAGGRIKCLRCTAMSKHTREQCRKPALKISRTQKCGHHGGRSTGPKTAEGKARIGKANLLHGLETNERRLVRSQGALKLAQIEDVMHALGMTTANRTTGRKPFGYRAIRTLEEAKAWVTLPRFYVHQIDVNFLMNGGRNEQEARCTKSAVYE